MKEDNNIDRLFQESFKDFEVLPPENAWSNIEKCLKSNSKRRVVPFWRRLTAAAAFLALLVLGGSQWYMSSPSSSKKITDSSTTIPFENQISDDKPNTPAQKQKQIFSPIETTSSSSNRLVTSGKENTKFNSKSYVNARQENSAQSASISNSAPVVKVFTNNLQVQPSSVILSDVSLETISNTLTSSSLIASLPQSIEYRLLPIDETNYNETNTGESLVEVAKLIAEEDEINKEVKQRKANPSWYIKPQVSPVFYGNMASGSAIDENFAQNNGQGEIDLSYGLNLGYQLSDKLKIRTGINKVNLNYTTNDLFILPDTDIASIANLNASNQIVASVVTAEQLDNLVDSQQLGRQEAIASDMRQSIGYIEFPLEMEYTLVDKKFGINLIGGASTFLLNDNSIDIINSEGTLNIGEANNINTFSFSTNFALGFDYRLSNRMLLNLEPTFKYQFNTFEKGTTDFQPYILGIYSGLTFKF